MSAWCTALILFVISALSESRAVESPEETFKKFCQACFADFREVMARDFDKNAKDNGELVSTIVNEDGVLQYHIIYGQVPEGKDYGNGTAAFSRGFRIRFRLNPLDPWRIWPRPDGIRADGKTLIRFRLPEFADKTDGHQLMALMERVIYFNAGKAGFLGPWLPEK